MSLIFLLLTAAILIINLMALSLLVRRRISPPGLARCAGIAVLVPVLFLLEHIVGLGQLQWLWPITTLASLYLLQHWKTQLWRQRETDIVFIVGFAYGFAWRVAFPELELNSEAVTNFSFLGNYLSGSTLPPSDHWLPPFAFDYYYALQHYAAALMGRSLGLDIGATYGFAWCITLGLMAELLWCLARSIKVHRLAAMLLVATVLMGGNGVAPLEHRLWDIDYGSPAQDARMSLWHNTRFIGLYDNRVNTELGQQLLPTASAMDLPLETIGYLTMQGDFHAPLGGFLLLLFALCLIIAIERDQPKPLILAALLALTVPLTLAVNAWVFPLQLLLVGTWFIFRLFRRQPGYFVALVCGAITALLLLYPYLSGLAVNSRPLSLQWVSADARTPWPQFLLLHWPWMLFSVLALWQRQHRAIVLPLVMVLASIMLLAELFHMSDGSGAYQRFNTTLKWWSWTHVAAVAGLGALALASQMRWIITVTLLVLLTLNMQTLELARFYYHNDKPHAGRFQADGTLAHLPGGPDILFYLKQQSAAVVLERPAANQGGYMITSLAALLSGHQAFIGWPSHLRQWGRPEAEIERRVTDIAQFYQGELPDAAHWLQHNNITHIIWSVSDSERSAHAFEQIQNQIAHQFVWHELHSGDTTRVGVWSRLD